MKTFDAEKFLNRWWSSSLNLLPPEMEEWIQKSYVDPELFFKEVVFAQQEKMLPQSQSIFGKSYNFYDDCVVRHVRSNTTALSIVKEKDQLEHWSYEMLHHCVNYHVDKWSYHSPVQGQLIVIFGTPGIHLFISFLTALRFGLKICYLPTNTPYLGSGAIEELISELKPDLIASEDPSFNGKGIPILTVNEKGFDEENYNPHSFTYSATSEVLLTIPLYNQETLTCLPLSAHSFYLNALKDGLFTLNLLQNPSWASPLACILGSEPASTLISLLCGVTRVYVADELIKNNPLILEDERINLLGISNELQQLWTHVSGMPTRYLKSCYKTPFDMNFQGWKTFTQLNKIEKIPTFHLLMDNSIGGSSLFSKPSLDVYQSYLKPSLATLWTLKNINGNDEEAINGFGIYDVFVPSTEEYSRTGNLTVSQFDQQLMLTGFIEPCREGVTFPLIEVEEATNQLDFVEVCMLHPIQKAGMVFNKYFVLLVFVTPMQQMLSEEDTSNWSKEIEKSIIEKVGSGYLPNHVEFFPLLPKMSPLGIDRTWCVNQYTSGLLSKKKNQPSYQLLSVLKKLVQQVNSESEIVN